MTQNGFGDNAGRIDEWLKDDNIDCFFELGMDKCAALKVSCLVNHA
jgi:hypothetical protein